jgi:hypothetical protein
VFDEIARQIGWIVIGGAIFYVVGKLILSHGETVGRKKELVSSTWDHQRRLAFRKIWRSSPDARIIAKVKMQYGPWVLLDIELDDEAYDTKMRMSESNQAYRDAVKMIENEGLPYVLEAGEIVATFTDEYKNRSPNNKDGL